MFGHLVKNSLIVAAAMLGFAAQAATSSFSSTYVGTSGNSTACSGNTYQINGQEPSSAGRHPVFIYTVGTLEGNTNGQGLTVVQKMADKGYVAAMVGYASGGFGTSVYISNKARCIFNAASAQSAIAKICARAKADCSKGIVTAGFSQGSVIATIAKDFDSRVRAAYAMGLQDNYVIYQNTASKPGNRALPKNRLRVANGINDTFNGGSEATGRESAIDMTGYTCTGLNCLQADGSGWVLIPDNEVNDGNADHCFMRKSGGCVGGQTAANNDTQWLNSTKAWALPASLAWLDSFVTH